MVGIYAGTERFFMSSAHGPDPSHGTAGAGSLGRLTTNTALPALQHKAPVLGQGLEVKQDIVGQGDWPWKPSPKAFGESLWPPIASNGPSQTLFLPTHHTSPCQVNHMSLQCPFSLQSDKGPFQYHHPFLSPSLPPRVGPLGESLKDTSPGPRKVLGRWHSSSPLQHTFCVNG